MLNKLLDSPRVGNIVKSALAVVLLLTAVGIGTLGILHSTTSTSTLPMPVGQNCGVIRISHASDGLGITYSVYSAVPANCLWNAFQRCQTATLTYYDGGLDTDLTHIIIVWHEDHGCSVSDTVRTYNDERVDYASYTCAGLRPLMDGVFTIIGCGDEGNVIIAHLG